MAVCYLGIGSNLGDKRSNIREAVKKVNCLKDTKVLKSSKIIRSRPQGGPRGQPEFLNAVLKIRTKFPPLALLKNLKKIETELGRKKTVRYGPRTIDLDILLYEDRVIQSKSLIVPHPKIFQRNFVLKPLLEVI